ncbi:hypothetical protein AERO8C_20772 [Aeromonas veronii]|uniref:Uncharacterized protein n=1 Tax=Aeromonas veronii TaxID=654 RepID=A0A653L2P8_AERVE|nr:hypothetical protein AERO8C_20772 [Aeromonas veronii]
MMSKGVDYDGEWIAIGGVDWFPQSCARYD